MLLFDLPMPRQELVQARLRRFGDAREDIDEPGLWGDVVELCSADEGVDRRGAHATAVGTGEQPGPSSESQRRDAGSAALFERQMRPSSRKRTKLSIALIGKFPYKRSYPARHFKWIGIKNLSSFG